MKIEAARKLLTEVRCGADTTSSVEEITQALILTGDIDAGSWKAKEEPPEPDQIERSEWVLVRRSDV